MNLNCLFLLFALCFQNLVFCSQVFGASEKIIRVDPRGLAPLPLIKKAPDFAEISHWINTKPLHIEDFSGKVVLVNFWTYSCINCIHTFNFLEELNAKYKDQDFAIVSIHTPEYTFEKIFENVDQAVKRYQITYPVGLDNDKITFQSYGIRYWPTSVIIDKNGMIRKIHEGEGAYNEIENAVRELLRLPLIRRPDPHVMQFTIVTPEIHLGFLRGVYYTIQNKIEPDVLKEYAYSERLMSNSMGITGKWIVKPDRITAYGENNKIDVNFSASKVYIVLSGISNDPIRVLLDGAPLPKRYYGKDMNSNGEIMMWEDRVYQILDLHALPERHLLTIHIPAGISVYELSFTN